MSFKTEGRTWASFLLISVIIILLSSPGIANAEQRRISEFSTRDSGSIRSNRVARQTNGSEELGGTGPEVEKKISPRIKYIPFELPPKYNKFQIPSLGYVTAFEKSVPGEFFDIFTIVSHEITVTIRVYDVTDVNELDEDITFSADLILQWKDNVIAANAMKTYGFSSEELTDEETEPLWKTLDQEFLNQIWKPDIFIERLVKVTHPEIMTRPVTVRLNEITGDIIFLARLRIEMECEMDFHYYPADTQTCRVDLRSHSYSTDELVLFWSEPQGVSLGDCGGPNFDFQLTGVDEDSHAEGFIGNKTRQFFGLAFNIQARRRLSYHMVQTYLPSMFFIIITWLCFLVPAKMVEARIGIAMTTLLTLTAMFASVRESSPTVSYVRAIDIWMVACIFFVFLTLLEFTVLLWLNHTDENKTKENKQKTEVVETQQHPEGGKSGLDEIGYKPSNSDKDNQNGDTKSSLQSKVAIFIEQFAFAMFSTLFVIFNLAYWVWLLIGSGYFEWKVDPRYNKCD